MYVHSFTARCPCGLRVQILLKFSVQGAAYDNTGWCMGGLHFAGKQTAPLVVMCTAVLLQSGG